MKKRLLSAALALAMVLTLLPLGAFAADEQPDKDPQATESVTVEKPEEKPAQQQPANAPATRAAGDVTLPNAEWSHGTLTVTDGSSRQVVYHTANFKDSNGIVFVNEGWYCVNTQNKTVYDAKTGVVNAMGAWTNNLTATWHANANDATQHNMNSFKLINPQTINGNASDSNVMWDATTSLVIDLNGQGLTWAVSNTNKLTSLSITNTSATPATVGGGITFGAASAPNGKSGISVNLTNVSLDGSVTVYNASGSSVTLDNAKLINDGSVFMTGTPSTTGGTSTGGTVTLKNGANVDGRIIATHKTAEDGVRNGTGAKVSIETNSSVTGAIMVEQTSGDGVVSVSGGGKANGGITVNQTSGNNTVSVTGSGSQSNPINVEQTTGGSITVSDSATTGTVSLVSTKGTGTDPTITVKSSAKVSEVNGRSDSLVVDINNYGRVTKDVNVSGRFANTLTGDEATTLIAPKVTVNGGIVGGGIANWNSSEGLQKDFTVEVKGGGTVSGTINLYKAQISVNGATVGNGVNLNSGVLTAGPNANVAGEIVLGSADTVTQAGISATMNVVGSGNTIGFIKDAASNTKTLALTIPGITDPTKQNPRDDDTNKIAGVGITDLTKVDKTKSYIAGGHYRDSSPSIIALLTPGITYVVNEDADTGQWRNYKVSYWGNSVNLINVLAGMTSIAETDNWPTIKTKDAPDSDAKSVSLYAYTPRTQPDGETATPEGPETNTAKPVLRILFNEPKNGSINTFILPSELGTNKSINWSECKADTDADGNTTVDVDASARKVVGGESIAPTDDIAYVSNALSYQVTKVLDVQTAADGQFNATVKAKLEGNTIVLSGLAKVYGTGNSAVIPLVMETDAIEKVYVDAVWNPTDKTLFFTDPAGKDKLSAQTGGGLIIANDGGSQLLVVANNTKISLKAGNLTEDTLKNVTFQGNTKDSKGGMVTTTNRIPDSQAFGSDLKKALADAMTVPAGKDGKVDFSLSPTVQQEFGSYIAKLNQNTLDGYLKKVQQDKYQEQYKKEHPGQSLTSAQLNALTPTQLAGTGYNTIAVVLYMNVDVTAFGNNKPYTMTATMTPYARVEIQHNDNAGDPDDWTNHPPVVVVNGTSLGTLDSGNVGSIKVTIPSIASAFPGQTAPSGYVHQNSTYVAKVTDQSFTLTHTAANGAGFGTIVLNNVEPLAEIMNTQGKPYTDPTAKLYDTVQAAVDETQNGETIKVNGAVGTTVEYPITVTGRARTIYIDVTGNRKITKANNSNDVIISQPTSNSTIYTVQLTRVNNVVKPTEKPIPISVTSATGGTAALSASRADEGDTITVTLTPATNYRVGGVTVTAAVKNSSTGVITNTTVATTAASTNSWRFVVPTGATSVTVTPSFVATTSTGATVTVSNASQGTATTSAGTNRVAAGSTVSVTTVPNNGYRTMGLYVTSESGTTTAYRTGTNNFTFTVPAGATNVVVTPRFDLNNGTVFEDVWSTEYYFNPVGWAVRQGITDGTSTYTFSPGQTCNRVQMVTFLWRAAGRPSTAGMANPFYDVSPSMGNDFYNAILWANAKGITKGDGSTTRFNPYKTVTRAEAVTFLWRYEGQPAASTNNGFYDVGSNEYYAQAVTWAVGKGITNGDGSTVRFNPNGACLRSQIVTFLYRDITGARA